jgi:hypothetical protein
MRADVIGRREIFDILKSLRKLAQLEGNYTFCRGMKKQTILTWSGKNKPYVKEAWECV